MLLSERPQNLVGQLQANRVKALFPHDSVKQPVGKLAVKGQAGYFSRHRLRLGVWSRSAPKRVPRQSSRMIVKPIVGSRPASQNAVRGQADNTPCPPRYACKVKAVPARNAKPYPKRAERSSFVPRTPYPRGERAIPNFLFFWNRLPRSNVRLRSALHKKPLSVDRLTRLWFPLDLFFSAPHNIHYLPTCPSCASGNSTARA